MNSMAAPEQTHSSELKVEEKKSRFQTLRRLYDWVLSWAETPYGALALFVLAFMESSFFPIPPDVLLIALVLGARKRWLYFAAICTLGSTLGGAAGYAIGYLFMGTIGEGIINFYSAQEYYAKVTDWYQTYDFWIVFGAAFTPIPYKVFTIASGAFHMNFPAFLGVSLVGRGMRFVLVSGLLYWFGKPIERFIDRFFNLLCVAFFVLLVGGFMVIKYLH